MAEKFNMAKLNGRVVEKFGTRSAFAAASGMSPGKLYPRLQGKCPFTAADIERIIEPDLLDIEPADIPAYFFSTEKNRTVRNNTRITRPDLTPEEYAKRMARIREAAARLFIAAEQARRKGTKE